MNHIAMAYDPSDIFTKSDLDKLTKSGVIQEDIIIRGEHLQILTGVGKINGFLGISDSNLESLGELREITGDFWMSSQSIFSRLTSLENIKKIGGEVSLRHSNIVDLGELKEVGGKLSLRDTPIERLGNLEYVGGDLYLPKRLQDNLNLSKVTVKGKIRFWNDSKTKKAIVPKEELGLIKYPNGVPFWKHQYIYSIRELENANYEQQQFYKAYKQKFKNGEFLDLEGNDNYSFILYYDLMSENIQKLHQQFKNLEKYYPKTKGYTKSAIVEKLESQEDYESAWKLKCKGDYIRVQTIIEYEQKLRRSLLDGELMVKLAGFSHLTEFGQNNIENIKPFADKYLQIYEKDKGLKFFELFFQNGKPYHTTEKSSRPKINVLFAFLQRPQQESPKPIYDAEYYKQFYLSEAEYNHYKKIDDSQAQLKSSNEITHVLEKAIFNQCRLILKEAENLYRESTGMPKVGEGWISETELFYKISDSFPEYQVQHHGSPAWLGRQHLDIYFPNLNIALEYQGAQHYVAVDFFGGEEALEKTKERDKVKRQKCKEHGCHLIYVDEGYDFETVKNEIITLINNGSQHSV